MSAIPIDWKPDSKKLREFGFISVVAFGIMGSLLAWRAGCFQGSGHWTAPLVVWALGLWGLLGGLIPALVKPLYLGLMAIAFPIGYVVSHLLLGLLYYGLFTPLALFFRLIGRDPLQRKIDRKAPTYWEKIETTPAPSSYFRQF